MSDRLISKNGLGKDEAKPNGAAGEGSSEKSLFDKLDDIMSIANKASAGNAERDKAEPEKAATATAGAAERPATDIKRGRDRDIERSFSDALDEIMNGKPKSGNGEAPPVSRSSVGGGATAATASAGGSFGSSATEAMLYRMLSELKADIDSLKRESDTVKSSAFAATPVPDQTSDSEKYLFGLLSDLRSDIDDLKHESHTAGVYAVGAGRARRGGEGELFAMLSDLRSDITTLKAESEAFMMHSGVAPAARAMPYAVQQPSAMRPVLIGAFTALAILAAAGGGYFFATMGNAGKGSEPAPMVAAVAPATATAPVAAAPATTSETVKAETASTESTTTRSVTTTAVSEPVTPITSDEESEMLDRAERLLNQGDIVAARMILDYAVSEGSTNAAYRLAQTYDAKYLAEATTAIAAQPDETQALTLYYFAARSGHKEAAKRLKELKAETGAQ